MLLNKTKKRLYYAFKKFDKSGNGYLSVEELRQILSKIGQSFTAAEVTDMMVSVGCDPRIGLDYQGFKINI
jgi:calmodulin